MYMLESHVQVKNICPEVYYIHMLDIPPTLRMYYGQVLYEVKKPGMEWLMRVFFERNLSRVKTVYRYTLCLLMIFIYST